MELKTINQCLIVGLVQAGGKIKTFEDGSAVANFQVMTQGYKASMDGKSEHTAEYTNIQVYNQVYDDLYSLIIEGNYILVRGPLKTHNYVDKNKRPRQFIMVMAKDISLMTRVKDL